MRIDIDTLSDDDLIDCVMHKGRIWDARSSGLPSSDTQGVTTGVFYEFFAGGGMARAGLGPRWRCGFANEIDRKKAVVYATNWGGTELHVGDVSKLTLADLPGKADLAWASFPCQDLSLAGAGAGLTGHRSGTFWPFWKLVKGLAENGRAPRLIVLENVCGALTSHNGKDFAAIGEALVSERYRFGALVLDAVHFLPQSRPRLFIVATRQGGPAPLPLIGCGPASPWHTSTLIEAYGKLSTPSQEAWVWWHLPPPPRRNLALVDLVEADPRGVRWHTSAETEQLLAMMSAINRKKLEAAKAMGRHMVGGIYRRTRLDEHGRKVQRAEVRFDDIAGCLRTPAGGSSRQTIIIVDGDKVRSRLLSPREAARLMGLPDDYRLPDNYNEAYHLAGDGVAVPVVKHLSTHLIEPLIRASEATDLAAA